MNKQELKEKVRTMSETITNVDGKGEYVGISKMAVLILIDELDEPEITEEQAWEVIAEIHNQDKTYWQDAKNHYVRSLNKPKQTEVPQFVADWIESHSNVSWWKTIALWENEVPEEDRKVYEWYEDCNEKDFINAWLNGNYIIEREPCWIVERGNGDYVELFEDSLYGLDISVTSSLDAVSPHRFTSKVKAEAVALLIDGKIKEIE